MTSPFSIHFLSNLSSRISLFFYLCRFPQWELSYFPFPPLFCSLSLLLSNYRDMKNIIIYIIVGTIIIININIVFINIFLPVFFSSSFSLSAQCIFLHKLRFLLFVLSIIISCSISYSLPSLPPLAVRNNDSSGIIIYYWFTVYHDDSSFLICNDFSRISLTQHFLHPKHSLRRMQDAPVHSPLQSPSHLTLPPSSLPLLCSFFLHFSCLSFSPLFFHGSPSDEDVCTKERGAASVSSKERCLRDMPRSMCVCAR